MQSGKNLTLKFRLSGFVNLASNFG